MGIMALLLSKQTPLGVDATYWRVISAHIDFGANTMAVFVAGYVDEAARNAGAAPLMQEQVNFTVEEFVADAPRNLVYGALKQLPDWTGATDA